MQLVLPWRLSPVCPRLTLAIGARTHAIALMALTCVAFALRLGLLSGFPLREDEAIYGYWARAATTDPFFLHVWPDKPPLFIWFLSGAFALLGANEATARLVSIFASTLTVPLVALGARFVWRAPVAALLAALLLAFNPYAISFAPTAYTDSLLVLLGMGALALACRGHGLGAGLLLGAACMTKQQGLFYAPLTLALLLCAPRILCHQLCHPVGVSLPSRSERPLRGDKLQGGKRLVWLLMGVALILLPILWWDSQRWAVAPSPWELAQRTYAPLTWLAPAQWLGRLHAWAEWLWYLGGSWPVWALLVAASGAAIGMTTSHVWHRPRPAFNWPLILIIGWGFAFLFLHLITSIQVWDRYLLPLAPWLALVASGPLAYLLHTRVPTWMRGALLILMLVALLSPAVDAARGQMPIGGDHGDYAGLTEAIAWVDGQAGPATLYHQALGWHFRFYLYDQLQPQGDDPPRFDLRWFPSAAYLADNAFKSPYPPKYLVVPDWATPRDLSLHLALRGLALEPRLRAGRFAVMEIVQPPRPLCDWCKSSLPSPTQPPFMLHELTLPTTLQMPAP